MKKIIISILIALCLNVPVTFAREIWNTPKTTIQNSQLVFLKVRDEYMLRYAISGLPTNTYQVRANFWSTTNVYYSVIFDNPTGVAYLTCNGTYIFEMLDVNGNTISETTQVKTTKIVSPTCSSYENIGLKNELDVKPVIAESDGSTIVNVQGIPSNAVIIEYWQNGEYKFSADVDSPGRSVGPGAEDNGVWTIVARDSNGNVIASTDIIVGGNDGGGNTGGNNGGNNGGGEDYSDGSCYNGCQWITDALNCPAWDDFMREWKSMLQQVYQPPNWQQVANVMRDTIVPAIGQELLNKSPQIADIFADEFTSREKQVTPAPTTPPTYTPDLPELNDLPQEIQFDLSNDIPNFEPDYTDSEPFTIPNPFDLQLSDSDFGYDFQNYEIEDRSYNIPPSDNKDIPQYNHPANNDEDLPMYKKPNNNEMPDYQIPDSGIRYYEGGE